MLKNVKKILVDRDMTMTALAALIPKEDGTKGVNPSYIYRLIKEGRPERIAAVLNVDSQRFLSIEVSMPKSDENGNVEFRVKFPATVVVLLERIAEVESQSIPGLIRKLTLERIAARSCERQLPNIIKSIIHNGKVRMENGGD